jgi:RHS repeat-associated protein
MLAPSPNPRPSPLPLATGDLCEAALSGVDPTGPRKYYRARYYDPGLGRFISEDPLGFVAGANFHEYVGSNPVVYGDPFGLQSTTSNWGPDSPFCELLRRAIEKAMSQLLRMRLERVWPRFTLSEKELQNHMDSYENMQVNLRKNLRYYRNANCGDPPPGAPEVCRRPYPTPEFEPLYPFGPPKQSPRPEQASAAAFAQTLLIIAIMIALAPVGM